MCKTRNVLPTAAKKIALKVHAWWIKLSIDLWGSLPWKDVFMEDATKNCIVQNLFTAVAEGIQFVPPRDFWIPNSELIKEYKYKNEAIETEVWSLIKM